MSHGLSNLRDLKDKQIKEQNEREMGIVSVAMKRSEKGGEEREVENPSRCDIYIYIV